MNPTQVKPVHIYAAKCSVNNKIYVGITVDLVRRKKEHKYQADIGKKTLFHSAIRKYGWNEFSWEIIETCPTLELAYERECLWIKRLNSQPPYGYNLTDGGIGIDGFAEFRTVNNSNQGRALSEEHRNKISEASKGKIMSPEARENMSKSAKSRGISEDTRKKMLETRKRNRQEAGL
jgi:group I intron endonuclease